MVIGVFWKVGWSRQRRIEELSSALLLLRFLVVLFELFLMFCLAVFGLNVVTNGYIHSCVDVGGWNTNKSKKADRHEHQSTRK
jgi:hypothetical protein